MKVLRNMQPLLNSFKNIHGKMWYWWAVILHLFPTLTGFSIMLLKQLAG